MTKLIWLSDLHFVRGPERVLGHHPTARLEAAIDDINAYHRDADCCIISGDLVNRGAEEEYQELKTLLEGLAVPYVPMVGNHDDRDLIKRVLDPELLPPNNDFIQYAIETEAGVVLCLDTLKAGVDAGEYCSTRYQWLGEMLKRFAGEPCFVFMHHPPAALGLPMQDVDCLERGDRFIEFVKAGSNVRHLFIGHVHRPICGTIDGVPFATMRSCLYQAPPPQPAWDWEHFTPAREAPNYGIVHIKDGNVLMHYHQFAPYDVGTG